ncbi:hypothetical protein AAMO2058_001090000 [Amorphochlora amoebiformis]
MGDEALMRKAVHKPSEKIVAYAENTVVTDRDVTCHAETNLVRIASREFSAKFRKDCVVYTSTEPCCMCAGAIYWAGIGEVVYGCPDETLYTIAAGAPDGVAIHIPSRFVFERGHGVKKIKVRGPVEQELCIAQHRDFWPKFQADASHH